jgi:hypothetical protein
MSFDYYPRGNYKKKKKKTYIVIDCKYNTYHTHGCKSSLLSVRTCVNYWSDDTWTVRKQENNFIARTGFQRAYTNRSYDEKFNTPALDIILIVRYTTCIVTRHIFIRPNPLTLVKTYIVAHAWCYLYYAYETHMIREQRRYDRTGMSARGGFYHSPRVGPNGGSRI